MQQFYIYFFDQKCSAVLLFHCLIEGNKYRKEPKLGKRPKGKRKKKLKEKETKLTAEESWPKLVWLARSMEYVTCSRSSCSGPGVCLLHDQRHRGGPLCLPELEKPVCSVLSILSTKPVGRVRSILASVSSGSRGSSLSANR
jgi:hypothetical protein